MAIRGWIYVMTNKSMPGLVKIGYSTKDPESRAGELGTGSPKKYEVVYDVLVDEPRSLEQRIHRLFADRREGKEWFRCEVGEAVNKIREVVGKRSIVEKLRASIFDYSNKHSKLPPLTQNAAERQRNRAYSIARLKEEIMQISQEGEEKRGK